MKDNFDSFNKKIKNIKKKFRKSYFGHTSKTFGDKQLDFYKKRLENVRLAWCQQVFEIVKKLNYSIYAECKRRVFVDRVTPIEISR